MAYNGTRGNIIPCVGQNRLDRADGVDPSCAPRTMLNEMGVGGDLNGFEKAREGAGDETAYFILFRENGDAIWVSHLSKRGLVLRSFILILETDLFACPNWSHTEDWCRMC